MGIDNALDMALVSSAKLPGMSRIETDLESKDMSDSEDIGSPVTPATPLKELKHDAARRSVFGSKSDDGGGRRISVAKFRAIMRGSKKAYQVENIIEDIKDDSGQFIPLSNIASYSKNLKTMRMRSAKDVSSPSTASSVFDID